MSHTDRSASIRRASTLPVGSPERKAILAKLVREGAEKVLYTVSINVPKESAKDAQKALDKALDGAIKRIKGMEDNKGVSSKLRD